MHRSRIRLLGLQLGGATSYLDVMGTIDFRSAHEAQNEVVAEEDEEGAEDADGDAADEGGLLDGHGFFAGLWSSFFFWELRRQRGGRALVVWCWC